MTQILLKARPTSEQLWDRTQRPVPEGLELYLDRVDLAPASYAERIRSAVTSIDTPAGFTWIVEAPIRTLGDRFFDLTTNDDDHQETIERVVMVGQAIGAVAANIHVVAPNLDPTVLTGDNRRASLDRANGLLKFYVERCEAVGLIPQIENVPPVGRMRESAYVFSPIGAAPDDLLALAESHLSLRFTVDLSHAALYLNWRRAASTGLDPSFSRAAAFQRERAGPFDLAEYLEPIVSLTTTVHVSNARGLLGEGLRYAEGDEDLDATIAPVIGRIPYLVTETLEPVPDHATGMRDAQERLARLAGVTKGTSA